MAQLEMLALKQGRAGNVPLFSMSASAGTAYSVDSDIERAVDLNEMLIEHPSSTFFVRVSGSDLLGLGVDDADILVVDSAVEPTDSKIIIAASGNDFTVKLYRNINGREFIQGTDDKFIPLEIGGYLSFTVIGTVRCIIHSI